MTTNATQGWDAGGIIRPKRSRRRAATSATTSIQTTHTSREPRTEEIAARAYEIWLANGRQHGRDVEHWLEAERQLRKG